MLFHNILHKTTTRPSIKPQKKQIADSDTQTDIHGFNTDSGSDSETYSDSKLAHNYRKKEIPVQMVASNYEKGKFFTIGLKLTNVTTTYSQQSLGTNSRNLFDEISNDFEITRIADESDEEIVCLNDVECYKSLDPNSKASYILERKTVF